jgi:hypothetical protein
LISGLHFQHRLDVLIALPCLLQVGELRQLRNEFRVVHRLQRILVVELCEQDAKQVLLIDDRLLRSLGGRGGADTVDGHGLPLL